MSGRHGRGEGGGCKWQGPATLIAGALVVMCLLAYRPELMPSRRALVVPYGETAGGAQAPQIRAGAGVESEGSIPAKDSRGRAAAANLRATAPVPAAAPVPWLGVASRTSAVDTGSADDESAAGSSPAGGAGGDAGDDDASADGDGDGDGDGGSDAVVSTAASTPRDAPPLVANSWEGNEPTEADMDAMPSWVFRTFGVKPRFKMRLYPKTEHISRAAKRRGFYGPLPEVKYLLRDVSNGLVVDCGANLGFVTLYAARLGHNVRSFEAQSDNHRMLLASLRHNKGFDERVRVYHRAAHWDSKPMQLAHHWVEQKGRKNSGIGTLAPVDKLAVGGRTRVEAQYETVYPAPVDAVVADNEYVDLMKVDVEGCQCHVLKSADKLLSSGRVRYLMMEVTPMNVCGCDHKESMTKLLQQGFIAHDVEFEPGREPPVVKRLVQIPRDVLLRGDVRDVVFVNTGFRKK